ncbi:MAG: hypothetical protein WBY53_02895 [Acidobacteriaceae bacterium]
MPDLTPEPTPEPTPDFSHPPIPDPSFIPAPTTGMPITPDPPRWSPATRLAFRFAFCYFLLYALCCGNATLWEVIPFHIGEHLSDWTSWPFFHGAQWLGQHYFHLTGVGAKLHGTGSGDTILNWIAVGIMLALAILLTVTWTTLAELRSPARRSLAYPRLFFWFRLIIRLTLAVAMMIYGLSKVFPLQMSPPSLAVLNEPLGNTSPMTMLWTLIGLNPVYEIICGFAELSAGILILFRRTGLLGELLTAFLAANIVLYNFCFDVPVKLYAAHLLLMAIVLIIPDMPGLFNFFILHRPCKPVDGWVKPARHYGLRAETIIVVIAFLIAALPIASQLHKGYAHQLATERNPPPRTGEWHITSATKPFLTGDGVPLSDIFFDPSGRTLFRSADGVLWRGGADLDEKKHTLTIFCLGHDGPPPVYTLTKPDPTHWILTPTGKDAKNNGTLTLVRVPLPTHYPLEDRGFHWVNEWGLER